MGPKPDSKDFPTRQLFVLALCRICEPIAFCSVLPYIYYMIKYFGNAKSEYDIAVYAGAVTSAFAFAEFTTGVLWGGISDRYGRKPVLIAGLAGTMLSMLLFGFSTSFPLAVVARAVGGALNGNVGVIQTAVAELATEKEHQAKAFAIMPFTWFLGAIIGPAIGGLLAEPATRYPDIFPPGGIFARFPYLLPNLVCASILACGVITGVLFLEETHSELRSKPDMGIRAGRKVVKFFKCAKASTEEQEVGGEETPLMSGDSALQSYTTSSPVVSKKAPAAASAFTRPVIQQVVSYGILAYHTMCFEELFPVFMCTPRSPAQAYHPFKFTGGFGLTTQSIGLILSVQSVVSTAVQLFLFSPIVARFGVLPVYRSSMFLYAVPHIVTPYLVLLPERLAMLATYVVLLAKITLNVLAYPCSAMLLTNAAPSMLVLGTINGVAGSTASISRALGPTVTGFVFSRGLDMGVVGLAWWVNAAVCIAGGVQCLWMREEDFAHKSHPDPDGDDAVGEEYPAIAKSVVDED